MMASKDLNGLLHRYTVSKVQIRRKSKTVALNSWQPKVERIIQQVSSYDGRFQFEVFPTGSFYDRLKVKEPDEFDLMLIMTGLELGKNPPYDGHEEHDGLQRDPPIGYTAVMIDQGEERQWNQSDHWVNPRGLLNAENVKATFRRHVSHAIQELGYERSISQTSQGPAVTLKIKKNVSTSYSIDMTLAIKDSSWPDDAAEWLTRPRHGWPSSHLIQSIKQDGCLLIAKQPKDFTGADKPYFWYYSFTHAEKRLFREGGHGEAGSCRKNVLRIMKALRENLQLTPLKSYHLKTIMLYECESKPNPCQWSSDQTWNRFQDAMKRLHQCLKRKNCPHYFMKEFNLFERMSQQSSQELAQRVTNILKDPQQYIT